MSPFSLWDLSQPEKLTRSILHDSDPYASDADGAASLAPAIPRIGCLAIDPEGRWIAVGRASGKMVMPHGIVLKKGLGGCPVRRLDREGGRVSWTVFPHTSDLRALAVSPDGLQIAAGSMNGGTVKILDVASGRELRAWKAHDGLCDARFSPDGRWLATSGFNDKLAILWEVSSGREVHRFRRHTGPVLAVAFSPDSQRLATGGSDGIVEIWDVITGQSVLSLIAHEGWIGALTFAPDGHRLASLGRMDRTLKIWDATPLEPTVSKAIAPTR
jgi:WD40 repeat protein